MSLDHSPLLCAELTAEAASRLRTALQKADLNSMTVEQVLEDFGALIRAAYEAGLSEENLADIFAEEGLPVSSEVLAEYIHNREDIVDIVIYTALKICSYLIFLLFNPALLGLIAQFTIIGTIIILTILFCVVSALIDVVDGFVFVLLLALLVLLFYDAWSIGFTLFMFLAMAVLFVVQMIVAVSCKSDSISNEVKK